MAAIIDNIYNLPYERKLELVELLGIANQLYSIMVEIHDGLSENVTFVDYKDIDNGIDYHFRNRRNMVAAETLYAIIKDNDNKMSQTNIFLKSILV